MPDRTASVRRVLSAEAPLLWRSQSIRSGRWIPFRCKRCSLMILLRPRKEDERAAGGRHPTPGTPGRAEPLVAVAGARGPRGGRAARPRGVRARQAGSIETPTRYPCSRFLAAAPLLASLLPQATHPEGLRHRSPCPVPPCSSLLDARRPSSQPPAPCRSHPPSSP
eukprot:scaffold67842_cov30-Tisochrysis_lutea.AAC.1